MFTPESYTIAAALLPRLLGLIFFFAFFPFLFQIKGLIGSQGILPLASYLNVLNTYFPRNKYLYAPTLFWLNASNQALIGLTLMGTLLSICLMLGIYPSLMLILLYVLYLSIVTAGQDFLGFGWEGFLLEITFQTFLMSLTVVPNLLVWISLNLLLFRFHFQAGAVKLQSKDPTWRNLTALAYHYQTQPIPNTIAWYAHKLPLWYQKYSTFNMFVIELIIPFGMLGNETLRLAVFLLFIGLQFCIWFTGNFSFLNHLTAVFCIILVGNAFLSPWFSVPVQTSPTPLFAEILLSLAGLAMIILQLIRLWNQFFPNRTLSQILNWLSPFHLANRYGIFAVMTTKRYEIGVEGSNDRLEWKEYLFRYKPTELTRRPRRISPFQPRLDWQAWFLPFTNFGTSDWFQEFLLHLLKGTPDVLFLLRGNPFPDHPPKYVRAVIYDYEFSSAEEKKTKGWWWRRKFIGFYSPILSAKQQPDEELED